jgi:uncharacterized repeat protein (TIGR03803 family)
VTDTLRQSISKMWSGTASAMLTLAIVVLAAASPFGRAQTFNVLYKFTGSTDGANPYGGLVQDKAGNLYGTTASGGSSGYGTIFELTPNSGGGWTQSVLYNFTGGADGGSPSSSLILDSVGNLYGTTPPLGGSSAGTVFELATTSDGWVQSVLYAFTGYNGGGSEPFAAPTLGKNGHLYGTTYAGGIDNDGIVYALTNAGGHWSEKTVYNFTGTTGDGPSDALIFDPAGNLYGTTYSGGSAGGGTVVELTRRSWKEKTLYNFQCDNFGGACKNGDAGHPEAGLVMDSAGNLYGAARFGGAYGDGAVFEVAALAGGKWKESVLYSFKSGPGDGDQPFGTLVFDKSGNLYGTAGGGYAGVVFKLIAGTDGHWRETIVHRFLDSDGDGPEAGLIIDASGNLYGTTGGGGNPGCSNNFGCGVVFEITP